jgi:hypothetical protein
LISSFWSVESNNARLSPYKGLFNRQSVSNCVPLTNDYCSLINIIHGIFPPGGNIVDSTAIFGPTFDNETLEHIILLGLQQYALFVLENPETMPDDFDSLIGELVRLAGILADQGSTQITWRDLKPLVQRLVLALFPSQTR